jgi:hypothetical protein
VTSRGVWGQTAKYVIDKHPRLCFAKNNPCNLLCRFDDVIKKLRTGCVSMTSNFPAPIAVPSRKSSKRRGQEGQPLTKHHRGVSIEEKDMLSPSNYSRKIRNYFEKHHLGVCAVHAIFSDSVTPDYGFYFPVCERLFRTCTTETGCIQTLQDALRVFHRPYSASDDGVASKKKWVQNPEDFVPQLKLKFGKPGVLSPEAHAKVVVSDFEDLMNAKQKKGGRDLSKKDNAVLIRQCTN